MEIKELIKKARAESGLTQEKAAEELCVSRQTISNWETGKSLPDIISILKMSDLYQISLDELMKGDKKMEEKIKKDASYEKEQKIFMKYTFISMLALLLIEVFNMIRILTTKDISMSYYMEEMMPTPFIVLSLCCLINALLFKIADERKSRLLAKLPIVVMMLTLLYFVFDTIISLIGTYNKYGIYILIGLIIFLVVFSVVLIKILNFRKKQKTVF